MDAIYTYGDYGKDSRPRLQFPKRTGRRTTYGQWLAYQYGQHHDGAVPALGAEIPLAPVIVNHGRWLWQCPGCYTAVQVSEAAGGADVLFCPACFGQAFVQPVFPDARAEIEEELLRQPGYRWNAPFRNWEPGWSLAHLRERTAAAQAQLGRGGDVCAGGEYRHAAHVVGGRGADGGEYEYVRARDPARFEWYERADRISGRGGDGEHDDGGAGTR